jgi:hypothetical protein
MRFVTIVLLLSTTTVHSQILYLDYGHQAQMPASFRQMYIAGAFDAVSVSNGCQTIQSVCRQGSTRAVSTKPTLRIF